MARVKIAIPTNKIIFSTQLNIRITDINYGGHLANDKLVSYLHEARVLCLAHFGWTEMDLAGVALIQGDLMVSYLSEGFLGDVLRFDIYIGDIGARSFEMIYDISKINVDGIHTKVAIAKVGLVCFDYQTRKTVTLPESFITKFNQ